MRSSYPCVIMMSSYAFVIMRSSYPCVMRSSYHSVIMRSSYPCVKVFSPPPLPLRADQGRLLDYIVSWGNLTEDKVACYLRDVLEALHYLHNSRVVHLDVKVGLCFLLLSYCIY